MKVLFIVRYLFVVLMSVLFFSCEKRYDCTITLYGVIDSHKSGMSKNTKEDMTDRAVYFRFGIENHTEDMISSDFAIEAHLGTRKTTLNGVPYNHILVIEPEKKYYKEAIMEKNNFDELGLDIYSIQPEDLTRSLTLTLSDSLRPTSHGKPVDFTVKRDSIVLVLKNSNYGHVVCGNCGI